MKLTDKKIGEMILRLEHKTLMQVGVEFGLDAQYASVASMKSTIKRHLNTAKNNPEKFGLTVEDVNRVSGALTARMLPAIKETQTIRERAEEVNNKSFADLVLSGRTKAMKLLHSKLDRIARSKKALDETNLSTLAQTAGILFDKGQIISGEATENVAVLAKIKTDMSPEDALKAVLNMREQFQSDKDRTNRK